MTTMPDDAPDMPEAADRPTDSHDPSATGETPARRIQIGTQRPGVRPPSLQPKYQYVTPPAGEAAVPTAGPSAAPVSAPPETAADARSAAAPPTSPGQRGIGGEGRGPAGSGRGGRRERRKDSTAKSPFADVLPPSKRVAVPNLRAALDDDLEADFEAALEGVAVEALLDTAADRAEKPLDPGTRVTGTVLAVGPDTAFIDLGGRRQGAMKLAGLLDAGADLPAVGQVIEVSVGSRNEEDGLYDVASANRAVAVEDWTQLQAGMVVEARVTAANKGGLECEVAGLRGFMPASLVSTWRIENLEELVGQTLESLVTELVPEARRLVLSRRAVIERQAADARAKLLETLEPGTELEGTVRSVREFGAFVDIGNGVEGLVHVSELSWERVANAADILQAGQKVRVIVKKIDHQTGKIGLSARDLVESPWKRAADKYHVGATVKGAVSRIAQFGAFVRLEPGVEGLVHISELATRHIRSVADVVREGQEVECRVLAVDPDEQRMSLSIKALAPRPAAAAADDASPAEAAEPEPESQPPATKRAGPLKGGLGGDSQGARFGLKW
jgi:predicted RNA-binding protein with RPS1 domain